MAIVQIHPVNLPNKYSSTLLEIDNRLSEIESEKAALIHERKLLVAQIESEFAANFNRFASPEEKVRLFLSYFKGRTDIYPFRWENKKGRSGYSPACFNEWQSGICQKPNISCAKCEHQAFKPLDEQAIYNHLNGSQTAGIYSLLPDNTCHFLAFDFDKADWLPTVAAFAKTCEELAIPYLLERSRSGNGGHVWVFFAESVQAKLARKLGTGLLHRTMERYPSLSFDCFDRMFPNQDIMPEGGFGNLIALPLQKEPRKLGNSAFIHAGGELVADQWATLVSVTKLTVNVIDELLEKLSVDELSESGQDEALKPWQKTTPQQTAKIDGCPGNIIIVLADQLYIPIQDLPGKLTSTLKRCAVFGNPEFFKRQAMRFSTIGISRLVWAVHIEHGYLVLPRGCLVDVQKIMDGQGIVIEVDDKRVTGEGLSKIKFTGQLKNKQSKAVNALAQQDNGILVAATGFGKTVVTLALVAKRKVSTLILVHSRQLAEQWLERAAVFLDGTEVGCLLGGKNKLTGQVDIATYQSLVSKNGLEVNPAINDYGQIIVDECHHLPASNFEALLKSSSAKFVHGVTATPKRADGLEKLMHFQLGPVVYKAESDAKQFQQLTIVRETATSFDTAWSNPETKPHISEVYKHLYTDQNRNQLICSDICDAVQADHSVMVLTERKEHITLLAELLSEQDIDVVELHGSITAKKRKERIDYIQSNEGKRFVILATGKYVGEGFDLPYLDTLFITLPIAWRGILAQYAGRIQREWSSKKQIRVFDYVDELPMLKRMWAKREKGYKALGYSLTSAAISE